MAGYLGLSEVAEHDISGAATFTAFNKMEGGGLDQDGGESQFNVGVGGQVISFRGMVVPVGNADTTVQTHALLACAKPASLGSLPPVIKAIQGGVLNDSDAARKQEDCYLDTVELSCDLEDVLKCSYSWKALDQAPVTIASAASASAVTPIYWHTADVDINGEGYKCQTWTASLANNLVAKTSQDAKVDNYRLPEWFDPGEFKVNFTADVRMPLGVDMTAQYISTITFSFTGTNNEGVPQTFLLDLTGGSGLHLSSLPIPLESGADEVLFRIAAEAEPYDLAIWSTSLV